MNRLLDIGFQVCGHWRLDNERLVTELVRFAAQRNVLYAFVSDGEVMYVGKTVQSLAGRMGGYRNPAPTQTTNLRNNARIRERLVASRKRTMKARPRPRNNNSTCSRSRWRLPITARASSTWE